MYLNKFSVRIEGGKEDHSGYVKIPHKKKYRIVLRNDWDEPCNAVVRIDGKDIGEGQSFHVSARGSIKLERPVNDDGCFTFFRSDSAEGEASGVSDIAVSDRGLIEVIFTPGSQRLKPLEKHYHHYHYYPRDYWYAYREPYRATWEYTWYNSLGEGGFYALANPPVTRTSGTVGASYAACSEPMAAGITGLSGQSDQSYHETNKIDLDYSRQTTIVLRLVEDVNGSAIDARPLTVRGNPIPPPVS